MREIIEKAGYKYPTFYVHIKNDDLSYQILARYGKALNHDFSIEFPEMLDHIMNDDAVVYPEKLSFEEMTNDRDKWRTKFISLNERYRILQDKYNKMLEDKLGIDSD